jgi:hypothetical protein
MRRQLRRNAIHRSRPSLELVGNWTVLEPGDKVVLYHGNTRTKSGSVELRSPNGSVFWIVQEGGQGRAMIHKADQVAVYRRTGRPVVEEPQS